MVVTYSEPKKGLPKYYFKQPLGNTTYGSPNLATLAALKHCRYLRYIYVHQTLIYTNGKQCYACQCFFNMVEKI